MIKYSDLVQYIKDNHVNWNTDLFDVLKGFFNQSTQPLPSHPIQQELYFPSGEFNEPEDGEYSVKDLIDLFSL